MTSLLRSSAPAVAAWAALGGRSADLERVQVTGDPAGLLPSRLKVQELMTAAVGSALLAVAALDAARNQAPLAPVSLSAEHVAVAARSERYARRIGSDAGAAMAPLSRFWRAADGWVRLHANYPWHLQRALDVLGCEDHPVQVGQAIAARTTADLEDSFAAAGGLAFAVRSPGDWTGHSQGRAVAAWGADVLRLDAPHLPEIPAQATDTLLGKRSAVVDLASSRGRAQLEELLTEADLLVQGYRPGALLRFGLGTEALAERHPHLSVVTLSAWGPAGPWARRRGFDSLVQCPTGIAVIEGSSEQPGAMPAQALDHATGYLAAAAGVMALAASQADRRARYQQLSLARTAKWLTDTGPSQPSQPREPQAEPLLAEVPGSGVTVRVVRPPGQIGDLTPTWTRTTDLGADPPSFAA